MRDTTLICGLGSAHGDDQVGWRIAERLAAIPIHDGVSVRTARSPAELLDWLTGTERQGAQGAPRSLQSIDRLIICDACQTMGSLGAVHCWRWPDVPHGGLRSVGTHDLGLADVLELAERLHLLPAEVVIWVVEIAKSRPGSALVPNLEQAAARVAEAIFHELRP